MIINSIKYFCIQTKSFNRGECIVKEGLVDEKDAKIHLIMHGSCTVEKKIKLDIENPFEKRKTVLSKNENIVIS